MATARRKIRVGTRSLDVSNLVKPLYPGGFTKGGLIDYYERIAPVILPHLHKRPVTFKRFPNGVNEPFFFEKTCNAYRPQWVKTAAIDYGEGHSTVQHCVLSSAADLVWAANLAAIEIHVSLASAARIERPKMIVFDLDPGPGTDILDCCRIALRIRDVLHELSLECLVKTSGGKGLHLYIPLNTTTTYDQTQPFAKALATMLAAEDPGRITAVMAKAQRQGKVYVDWAQNMLHKTTVCVYSMRARQEPSVSTPITFEEVEKTLRKKNADLLKFGPEDVLRRVDKSADLFEPALTIKQKLPALDPAK